LCWKSPPARWQYVHVPMRPGRGHQDAGFGPNDRYNKNFPSPKGHLKGGDQAFSPITRELGTTDAGQLNLCTMSKRAASRVGDTRKGACSSRSARRNRKRPSRRIEIPRRPAYWRRTLG
jgi:hypothetical protein